MKRSGRRLYRFNVFLVMFLVATIAAVTQGQRQRPGQPPPQPPGTNKLQVKCVDSSDKPLDGVRVLAQEPRTNKVTEGKTDRNGVVQFKELADGVYRVYARQPGYAPAFEEPIRLKGGAEQTATLKFQTGDQTKKLYFEDPALMKQASDLMNAGVEALRAQDFTLAVEKLTAALAIVPTSASAQYFLGVAYFYHGKYDQGQTAIETAIRLDPDEPTYKDALQRLPGERLRVEAQQAMQKENYQEAVAKFTEIVKLQPNNPDAYYDLSLAYGRLNQYDKAIEIIDQAIKLKPGEKDYEDLKKIIINNKEAIKFNQAKQLADEGDQLYQAKNFAAALEKYKAAEALLPEPSTFGVRFQIGKTHAQLGQAEEALAAYRRAIELKPDRADYRRALAEYYYQLGRTPEAMETYIEYFKQANTPPDEGLFKIGKQLITENKQQQAAAVLEKVLEVNPAHAEAMYELGVINFYSENKDKTRANQLLTEYVKVGQSKENVDNAKALLTVIKQTAAKPAPKPAPKRPARKPPQG
jgi:Flp pilus assembly protein TadD